RQGRMFNAGDNQTAPGALILNEAAAKRLFPGENPIGQPLLLERISNAPVFTVVGIAADTRERELTSSLGPAIYIPYAQQTLFVRRSGAASIVLRSNGDSLQL